MPRWEGSTNLNIRGSEKGRGQGHMTHFLILGSPPISRMVPTCTVASASQHMGVVRGRWSTF